MKKLLHLLLITQCALLSATVLHAADNLTSFNNNNGGAINNNQYNQMMNPERAAGTSGGAAASFGNCDALIQRCVVPKCGTGCTDQAVAAGIVNGCVMDSAECKKYADAIISATVAQSLNKANAQAAAAQQQAASAQQMEQMNQQMQAMQQQMADQQAASQQQMQQALAEQQAANQALLAQQQQAAAAAAAAPAPAAASAPAVAASASAPEISAEMNAREQIVGQVLSSLDGVDAGLRELKTTVQNVIDYAGCDYNANSCTGPKRVAAFRVKAQAFFQPYDNVLDALDNSLNTAIVAGIDVSDIYMMLTNSCSQWGKYLCPPVTNALTGAAMQINPFVYCVSGQFDDPYGAASPRNCQTFEDAQHKNKVQDPRCTFVEMYNNNSRDEIQQNFIASNSEDATNIRMACISDGVLQSGIFARRNRRKSNDFDIDALQIIIDQDEPRTVKSAYEAYPYCDASANKTRLEQSVKTRKYTNLLVKGNDTNGSITAASCNLDTDDMCYANPMYAMCTTHIYNSGAPNNDDTVRLKDAEEIIALKSTVIAQQLKKQSDYLNSMVKQIKTQLQRSVMTAKAEAAGAPSSSSSSSSAGALPTGQIDCRFKTPSETASCIRNNLPGLNQLANGTNATDFRNAAKMNVEAVIGAGGTDEVKLKRADLEKCYSLSSKTDRTNCVSSISLGVSIIETAQRAAAPGYGYPPRY